MVPHAMLPVQSSLLVPFASSTASSPYHHHHHPLLSHPLVAALGIPHVDDSTKRTAQLLCAGGFAGGAARTIVAPLDRIKILMQTQALLHSHSPNKYRGLVQALSCVRREEGAVSLWKGNFINILRVIPYSACQFATYDLVKAQLTQHRALGTSDRLVAGASAGMLATLLTHPMDVVRLRLSVDKELKSSVQATKNLLMEGGVRALFKGLVPSMLSVSPFIAINFATFDALKSAAVNYGLITTSTGNSTATLLIGGASGLFAQSICYPLDTIRRRMQLKGTYYSSMLSGLTTIIQREGVRGLYRGSSANAIKIVPQNAIRFFIYDTAIQLMGVNKTLAGSASKSL